LTMGCYGIGIGRLAASCIEQNNDSDGIIWPESIAPFRVVVIPITNKDNRNMIDDESFKIYQFLLSKNVDVAIDDRELRPGNKFADADLIGIPIRIVISEKNLSKKQIEIKYRDESESFLIDIDNLEKTIQKS
jgi:prolyl-tRNA synthetase